MRLLFRQWLPAPHEAVSAFFSDTANLLRITPPWPRLSIEAPSTAVVPGAAYLLRFSFGPASFSWQSRIVAVTPGRSFTDVSGGGLLGEWRHTHSFTPESGGTLLRDEVICTPPWWCAPLVRAGIHLMFLHRKLAMRRIFP